MKKFITLLLVLITCSVGAIEMGPYDPGAARKTELAERLDTVNASFTGDIDVTGDVGAATVSSSKILSSSNGFYIGDTSARGIAFKFYELSPGGIATLSVLLATTEQPTPVGRGRLTVTSGSTFTGVVFIKGSANRVVEIEDVDGYITTSAGSAGSLNIYSVGSSQYELQNTGAATMSLTLLYQGY